MKTYIKSIVLLSSLVVSVTAFASGHGHKTMSMSNKKAVKKTIMVSRDKPEFTVKLAANPTTGYNWYVKYYPTKFITPVSSKYQAPDSTRVGAGGEMTFTFKVNPEAFAVPHLFRMRLVYAQAWNLKDATKKTIYIATNS